MLSAEQAVLSVNAAEPVTRISKVNGRCEKQMANYLICLSPRNKCRSRPFNYLIGSFFMTHDLWCKTYKAAHALHCPALSRYFQFDWDYVVKIPYYAHNPLNAEHLNLKLELSLTQEASWNPGILLRV